MEDIEIEDIIARAITEDGFLRKALDPYEKDFTFPKPHETTDIRLYLILEAIHKLYRIGEFVDVVTITEFLDKTGLLYTAGDAPYLATIVSEYLRRNKE